MSKTLKFSYIVVLFAALAFAAPAALAQHGDGGGGDSGGSSSEGSGNDRSGARNSEAATPPGGFEDHGTASTRTVKHQPKQVRVPTMILKALEGEGQRSRNTLSREGQSDWDGRAGQAAKNAWDTHGASAYDVTARTTGQVVSQNPGALRSPHPATAQISQQAADNAWRNATQNSAATGNGGMAGFGSAASPPTTGAAKALRNMATSP